MSDTKWPVEVLPREGPKQPAEVLTDLLAPEGAELAERRKLAEDVLASIGKYYPSPMLRVDQTTDDPPGFKVNVGGRALPAGSKQVPNRSIEAPTLTQALRNLLRPNP